MCQSGTTTHPAHNGEKTKCPSPTWHPYVKTVSSSDLYSRPWKGMSSDMDWLHKGFINMPHDPSPQVSWEHPRNTLYTLFTTGTDLAIGASMPGTTLPEAWTHGVSLSLACAGFTPWRAKICSKSSRDPPQKILDSHPSTTSPHNYWRSSQWRS